MFDSIVLNEASLPFDSEAECEANLESFFEILHRTKLFNVQFSRADEIEGDWNSLIYADNFQLGQWLNSITDKDKYRQIQSVLTNIKCPIVTLEQQYLFHLTSDDDIEVNGLGYASLNNAHGLSFPSKAHWKTNHIPITQLWDSNGQTHTNNVNVPNVCTLTHIEQFLYGLEQQQQAKRDYFSSINSKNNVDFSNLLFTESALKTFRSSSLSSIDYHRVLDALNKLDAAIVSSNNLIELATNSKLRISGESAETMACRRLIRLRRFKHPDSGFEIFEDHIKNFQNGKRMHIIADYVNNKVCIGYFGTHLKTSSA